MMIVYGITNCDTVKKALNWFKQHHIDYEFHDFKKLGISTDKLNEWNVKCGYEGFLNKKGLTWKQLPAEEKEKITSAKQALPLLQQKTNMIKRPVIDDNGFLFFGFDEAAYQQHFLK